MRSARVRAALSSRTAYSAVVLVVLGLASIVGQRAPRSRKPQALRENSFAVGFLQLPAASGVANDDPHDPGRVQREHQLIGALNEAMDRGDVTSMRSLITRYREHDPGDAQQIQAGYERIADCLQYPGEDSRERARAYQDQNRAPAMRRQIRRACFE